MSLSSKAYLLKTLRLRQGEPVSGSILAKEIGISRVAVWKAVQSLLEAGYAIETSDTGYSLNPENEKDFIYPWEFGEKENLFYHYKSTSSTMDRARELALRGAASGSVIAAEKQNAGRGRVGRTWVSRKGGLFFSVLERPPLAVSDYTIFSLSLQIASVRTVSAICGKKAYLRWPNDVYIDRRKIAGVTTEISGEGDMITWLCGGVGINVNNPVPSAKAASCAEITKREISRKLVLNTILDEFEKIKKTFISHDNYSQGNFPLAAEWNSLTDCIGAKVAVFEPAVSEKENPGRILCRGIFNGIDPGGRCIIKTEKGNLYFNQGSASLSLLNPE